MNPFNLVTREIVEVPLFYFGAKVGLRAYLVLNPQDRQVILIDTGAAGNAPLIAQTMRTLGYEPRDLAAILITHWHEDHTGSLGAMMDLAPQAQVLVPPDELAFIRDQGLHPLAWGGLLSQTDPIMVSAGKLTPAQAAQLAPLESGHPLLQAWDLQPISTPGHSEGHVALYSPTRRALFAGDALLVYGRTVFTLPHTDQMMTEESALALLELDFDYLLPGHVEAMRYRISPADRHSITTPAQGIWQLLSALLGSERLVESRGPLIGPAQQQAMEIPRIPRPSQRKLLVALAAGLLATATWVWWRHNRD